MFSHGIYPHVFRLARIGCRARRDQFCHKKLGLRHEFPMAGVFHGKGSKKRYTENHEAARRNTGNTSGLSCLPPRFSVKRFLLHALLLSSSGLEDFAGPPENLVKHLPGQPSRLRILAAGVVGTDERESFPETPNTAVAKPDLACNR